MIIFFAKYPKRNNHDGYAKRILQVDQLFDRDFRIYIQFRESTKPSLRFKFITPKCLFVKLNIHRPIGRIVFLLLVKRAQFIYAHSIYNLTEPINLLDKHKKLILDLHGVVPEELVLMGEHELSSRLEDIEKRSVSLATIIITVSDNMSNYYRQKYKGLKLNLCKLPIDNNFIPETAKSSVDKYTIIYSGGIQKWQNTDAIVKFINNNPNLYHYIILTKDITYFDKKIHKEVADIEILNIENPTKLAKYYRRADMGFILRESNIINKVACPTKLIDYLTFGIIPIVLQPQIGDFNQFNYKYINFHDLQKAPSIGQAQLARWANQNLYSLLKLRKEKNKTESILRQKKFC